MRPWALAALLAVAQMPAAAQDSMVAGSGVLLRGLDKVDGDVVDMSIDNGGAAELGRLSIELLECRYPQETVSEAFAFLTIRESATSDIYFDGWMLAASPALNALEHPRYDIWVLGCKTE